LNTTSNTWTREFQGSITVCDSTGIIIEMNKQSAENYLEDGGEKLIGRNMFDCHPEPARTKLRELMEKRQVNVYTIEKKGKRKLIYQAPWYVNGKYGGFVELSMEIPEQLPHFIRDP
jgi:transcriptional regulator with PAS, ATPase and Fis domain